MDASAYIPKHMQPNEAQPSSLRRRIGALLPLEPIYFSAFALYCFGGWIRGTSYEVFFGLYYLDFIRIVNIIALALLLAVIFFKASTYKELLIVACAAIPYVATSLMSGSRLLLWDYLLVVGAINLDIARTSKVLLGVLILVLSMAGIGLASGVLADFIIPRHNSEAVRHALGMNHPNTLAFALFILCLAYYEAHNRLLRLREVLVVAAITVVSYMLTESRTWCAANGALWLFLLERYLHARRHQGADRANLHVQKDARLRSASIACVVMLSLCIATSIYFMIWYDENNPLQITINKYSSNRLALMHHYYLRDGVPLFGQRIVADEAIQMYNARGGLITFLCDNIFASTLINFGIAGFLEVFVPIFLFLLRPNTKNPRLWLHGAAGITGFFVAGLLENYGLNMNFDFFLVYLSLLFATREIAPIQLRASRDARTAP